jgi:RIO-like serine/threonine protein kinase
LSDDSWDLVAVPILDFVRENSDEMDWVSFSAIMSGTGLDPDQIIDEVERLCAMGLVNCRLRWCTAKRSWSA